MSAEGRRMGDSLDSPYTRPVTLHGPWLLVARIVWVVVATLGIVLFVIAMPHYHHMAITFTNQDGFVTRHPAEWRAGLHHLGLTPGIYAAYLVALQILVATTLTLTGLLIFLRKADEWIGLVVSLTLLTFGTTAPAAGFALAGTAWEAIAQPLSSLSFTGFFLLSYIFPDGRFVPRWTRWPAAAWLYSVIVPAVLPRTIISPDSWPAQLDLVLTLGLAATFFIAPIYRYRWASDLAKRQQMKWALLGLLVPITGFALALIAPQQDPSLVGSSASAVLYDLGSLTFVIICFSLVPVFFGIAIFRYRLWDIEVLVNRTLVYGLLTISLGLVYGGGVVALQAVLRALTGQGSNVAIAISTLAIAALFHPLRGGIQSFIDRRFYRRKYDAVRTLAAFSARLRDEVDLDQLTADLIGIVDETMHPSHISLWLR